MKIRHGSKIYLIGVLAVIIFLAGYFGYNNKTDKIDTALNQRSVSTVTHLAYTITPSVTFKWLKIVNIKYFFSIEYPSYIDEADSALNQPEIANMIQLNKLRIIVLNSNGSALKEFVYNEWEKNNVKTNNYLNEKKVGPIVVSSVNGISGYQYTVTKSIAFGASAEVIEGTYIMRYIQNKEYIYLFAYPINSNESQQILDSFKIL